MINTWKPAERGDSGGISLAGSLAALGGSFLIAVPAVLIRPDLPFDFGWDYWAVAALLITLAGFGGSLIDSLLGATVQVIYICPACGKETERHPLHTCGTQTVYKRGWRWMNNDAVNAFCTVSGVIILLLGGLLLPDAVPMVSGGEYMITIPLSTPAFTPGEPIPAKFTCEGENVSPALEWDTLPAGTKGLALIMDDPDAPMGTFVHWVIYNIPASLKGLPEGVKTDKQVSGIGTQGNNGARRSGYTGPCPPPGKLHRYYFTLYALNTQTSFEPGFSKEQVLQKIEGQVLATGQVMGTYQR
jgi:Raf kinase inhibitor-like YbhB/YbcL family protein